MNIPGVSIIKGEIIDKIDLSDFSSHLFIKKFAERFEDNYIEMLNESPWPGRFKKVHSKLGMFLTQNAEELKIRKVEKSKVKTYSGIEIRYSIGEKYNIKTFALYNKNKLISGFNR